MDCFQRHRTFVCSLDAVGDKGWEIPLMLQLEYKRKNVSVFLDEERILKPHSSLCLVVYRIIFSIFANVISCNSWR